MIILIRESYKYTILLNSQKLPSRKCAGLIPFENSLWKIPLAVDLAMLLLSISSFAPVADVIKDLAFSQTKKNSV